VKKQEILIVCESMQQEIKLIRRAAKLNLPISVTQDSIGRICESVTELEKISKEIYKAMKPQKRMI